MDFDSVAWTADEVAAGESPTKGIPPRVGPVVSLAWNLREILVMTDGFMKTHHEIVLLGQGSAVEEPPAGVQVMEWLGDKIDAAERRRLRRLSGSADTFAKVVLEAAPRDVGSARETLMRLGGGSHSTAEIASSWRKSEQTKALGDGLMGTLSSRLLRKQL
jgi:hypothetical protein